MAWSCSPLPTLEARLPPEARLPGGPHGALLLTSVRCPHREPGPSSGCQRMGADAARCLPGPGTIPDQPISGPVVPVWNPLKTVL